MTEHFMPLSMCGWKREPVSTRSYRSLSIEGQTDEQRSRKDPRLCSGAGHVTVGTDWRFELNLQPGS